HDEVGLVDKSLLKEAFANQSVFVSAKYVLADGEEVLLAVYQFERQHGPMVRVLPKGGKQIILEGLGENATKKFATASATLGARHSPCSCCPDFYLSGLYGTRGLGQTLSACKTQSSGEFSMKQAVRLAVAV